MYLFPRFVLLFIFYPTKNHEKKKKIQNTRGIHITKAHKIVQVGDERQK